MNSQGLEQGEQSARRQYRLGDGTTALGAKTRYGPEQFKCPPAPNAGQVRTWKNTVYQNINAASGRLDSKALEWALQVEDDKVSDEDLHKVSRKFAILSQKIAAKLQNVSGGELGRLIANTV